MKKLIKFAIAFLVLVALAISNPTEEQHAEYIVNRYQEQNPISGTLGVGHGLAELATYHNYIFFSSMSFGEEQLSWGFGGTVKVQSVEFRELPKMIGDKLRGE